MVRCGNTPRKTRMTTHLLGFLAELLNNHNHDFKALNEEAFPLISEQPAMTVKHQQHNTRSPLEREFRVSELDCSIKQMMARRLLEIRTEVLIALAQGLTIFLPSLHKRRKATFIISPQDRCTYNELPGLSPEKTGNRCALIQGIDNGKS